MTNERRDFSTQKKLAAVSSEALVHLCHIKRQGWAIASCLVTLEAKFYAAVFNVCGCSVWKLLNVWLLSVEVISCKLSGM